MKLAVLEPGKSAFLESSASYTYAFREGLAPLGFDIVGRDQIQQLDTGDIAIIPRSTRALTSTDLQNLSTAGARGITRVLWQTEPLPPSNLTGLSEQLMRSYVNGRGMFQPTNYGLKRGLSKVADWAVRNVMAADLRRNRYAEAARLPSPKMLGYPLREARALKELWDRNFIDRVFVSLPSRQIYLEKFGIPSTTVPAAYGPWYGRRLDGIKRDIDVLFLGRVSPRRAHLIDSIRTELGHRGFVLHVVNGDCYGEDRTQLFNRSKIALVLHNFTWEFPLMRLFMAMSCGALVVSESALTPPPFFDDRHLVVTETNRLVDTLATYLNDEALRTPVINAAYLRATCELTFTELMGRALLEARSVPARVGQ